MTAPERIWLQDNGDFDAASEVTWCQHRIEDNDTEYVRADLAAVPAQVRVKPLVGWVIGNGQGNRWRCVWEWETNAEWTDDISKAIKFATRDDAEAFAADDEDAWLIQEVPIPSLEPQPDPRDAVIARLVGVLRDCDGGLGALGVPRDAEPRSTACAALAAAKAVQHG